MSKELASRINEKGVKLIDDAISKFDFKEARREVYWWFDCKRRVKKIDTSVKKIIISSFPSGLGIHAWH